MQHAASQEARRHSVTPLAQSNLAAAAAQHPPVAQQVVAAVELVSGEGSGVCQRQQLAVADVAAGGGGVGGAHGARRKGLWGRTLLHGGGIAMAGQAEKVLGLLGGLGVHDRHEGKCPKWWAAVGM